MNDKLDYLLSSTKKLVMRSGLNCPNCGAESSSVEDRKYLVTTLVRCGQCHLLFRRPITSESENEIFYQSAYAQGFTTDIPDEATLAEYLRNDFQHPEKNYRPYIKVIASALGRGTGRVFEFGCSWGYGSYQLAKYGFTVESYEISQPRASFAASKLNIHMHADTGKVSGPFDVFFSSHVLEHVPSVSEAISLAWRILAPGGLFIAVTPNGSAAFRQHNPEGWHKLWGRVHPNFLDDVFYRAAFKDKKLYLASAPYDLDDIAEWRMKSVDRCGSLGSDELLAIAVKG